MSEPILSARGVSFRYPGSDAGLDDVSVEVRAGESVALVGESGSGKTTLARVLLGLLAPRAGEVLLDGEVVRASSTASMRTLRRSVQTVFQDPFSSLDPCMTIGASIAEPLHALGVLRGQEARARVREVLTDVGIDPARAGEYPGSFSGGQRQRIAIARALAPAPRVLIADEPVSALDMSTRASVMDLLGSITRERGMALVLVSHDLATVASTCDRIVVMQEGRIARGRGHSADHVRPARVLHARTD